MRENDKENWGWGGGSFTWVDWAFLALMSTFFSYLILGTIAEKVFHG